VHRAVWTNGLALRLELLVCYRLLAQYSPMHCQVQPTVLPVVIFFPLQAVWPLAATKL